MNLERCVPGFDVLYEDNACLVVVKPAGLLTQAPLGIDSLEFRIKQWLKERDSKPGKVYLGVPHRIDRPVSGVMVFAKNVRAARRISEQFEGRLVEKTYWALVEGHVAPDEGTWTDQLKKIEGQPRSVVVEHADPEGRLAVLHYRVVRRLANQSPDHRSGQIADRPDPQSESSADHPDQWSGLCGEQTLLEIALETGRTHQIRVQCASRGHPLLGDELYGSRVRFGPWSDDERQRLIALHARSLKFLHPQTREPLEFVAPLPDTWKELGIEA